LCEEVHLNIAYRWFCRLNLEDEVPDHSPLTRIRDRFGANGYRAIFERIISEPRKKGLIKGKKVIVDASIFAADASMDSLVEREDGDPDARELKEYEKRYHDFKTGKKKRKVSNLTHVSRTDPDATLVSRRGQHSKLSHKARHSIDGGSRLIVDCHATTGATHECMVLSDRLKYLYDGLHLLIEKVIADKGYGRGPTYSFLRERRIRVASLDL
jgi:IS5 family transposase